MKLNIKNLFVFGIIFVSIIGLISILLPKYIEKSRNKIISTTFPEISERAKDLHRSLFIADLHSDSLLWDRNLEKKSNYGHVDIPRLIEGNVGLQVFSVVTKTPKNLNLNKNSASTDNITLLSIAQAWPPITWFNLFERASYQAKKLQRVASNHANHFSLIENKQDFSDYLAQRNPNMTAGILSLEGAHALEGKIENLDQLFALGFRVIGFAHFFDNKLGGSAHGINKGGITGFGMQVLKRMEELKIFIDISHASPKLIEDIFNLSSRPILATHTGVQGVCPSSRNLNDQHIKQIAQSGGIVGIGFWPTAVCGKSIAGIIESIRYVKELVGIDHVALGSDFDGNVTVPFSVSDLSLLTQALLHADFSENQIEKIMGGNIKNLLLQHLPDK